MTGTARTCPDCHQPLPPVKHARGVCLTDYNRRRRQGTHLALPTKHRPRTEVVDQYLWLRTQRRATAEQVAADLGMTVDAVKVALKRAAAAGDRRIDYQPRKRTAAA